ncbi:MAG TPA: hypothetical protein VHJ78_05540 [Actinomycetota bacterium]|nr:hypothetical protein [Actinomycetota bacterium]
MADSEEAMAGGDSGAGSEAADFPTIDPDATPDRDNPGYSGEHLDTENADPQPLPGGEGGA